MLVLSHYAMRLLHEHPERVGYLLKERLSDIAVLADALQRIAEGESVLEPTIVTRLVNRPREQDPLAELTERERQVLELIAEGRSNQAISTKLFLSPKTIETGLPPLLTRRRHPVEPAGGTASTAGYMVGTGGVETCGSVRHATATRSGACAATLPVWRGFRCIAGPPW